MPEPKPGYCRCGKKDEDCPICEKCASPHASCLPCKARKASGGPQQSEAVGGEFRAETDACGCRHLAGVHALSGQCLVAKIDATGAKKLQPPGATPAGITRCSCTGFSPLVAKVVPPPEEPAEDEIEDEPEDEVDEVEDDGVDVVA